MNKTMIIGRLTKDPEIKFLATSGTANCTFTVAVDRKFSKDKEKKEADFIPCVAWSKTAEYIANYSAKGKLIAVQGRIQTRNYTNKDNVKVYITEIIVEEVQILEWANSDTPKNEGFNAKDYGADVTPVNDDDIPFK